MKMKKDKGGTSFFAVFSLIWDGAIGGSAGG
jgi:hypothetical protein